MCKEAQIFERFSIKINYYLLNGIHSRNMLTKKKLMKGVKKVINILVRTISIRRMKLLMLPKAKKPNHFACKMGLHTSILYINCLVRPFVEVLKFEVLSVGFQDLDRQTDKVFFFSP